jgi:hypothetical protein
VIENFSYFYHSMWYCWGVNYDNFCVVWVVNDDYVIIYKRMIILVKGKLWYRLELDIS